MKFEPWIIPLALIAACATPAEDDTDDTTDDTEVEDTDDTDVEDTDDTDDTDTTEAPITSVLRDCAPTVGNICPYAGASRNGYNGAGKPALDTWFSFPMSITFSPLGKPVVSDWNNHKLRLLEDDGTFTTIMGTDFLGDGDADRLDNTPVGSPVGAPGTTVDLNHPTQHIYLPDGTLLSASWHTHKLRTWDPETGLVKVYLGGAPGFNEPGDGVAGAAYPAASAKLNQPRQVLLDDDGNILILDQRNERIRLLDVEAWTIRTIAGNGTKGYCGEGDLLTTCFNFPKNANPEPGGAMVLSEDGTKLFVADTENHAIRVLDLDAGTSALLAGLPGTSGNVDGAGDVARFNFPTGLALDGTELFVADANNHKVRVVDTATGAVSTFAGTGESTCDTSGHELSVPILCQDQFRAGDGGPATDATLYRPFGVDLDLEGNLVISDTYNNRFRIVYR